MSEIDYNARRVKTTKPGLGSFLNLDEPRRVSKSPKEEPKYSIGLELEPDSEDLKAIRAKIMSQAIAFANSSDGAEFASVAGKTAESIAAAIRSGAIKTPIEDGTKIADREVAKNEAGRKPTRLREWSRGLKVVTARTQKPPAIAIIANGAIVQLDDASQVKQHNSKYFFTGAKIYVELDIVPYNPVGDGGKPGVTAYLASVLSTGKGEKLIAGGANLAETFKGYVGLETDEDPRGEEAAADTNW